MDKIYNNQFDKYSINKYNNSSFMRVNPYIRRAIYDNLSPHFCTDRVIYDYELLYIKSGAARVIIEDREYDAVPGDVFLIRPGRRHQIRALKQIVQPHIHFDLEYDPEKSETVPISFKNYDAMNNAERGMIGNDLLQEIYPDMPEKITLKNPLYFEQLLFDVIVTYQIGSSHTEIRLKWQFLHLLDELLFNAELQTMVGHSSGKDWAMKIKKYIENSGNRRISLEELSNVFNLEKSYISKVYKRSFKTSPIKYNLILRIENAYKMLIYTNASITAIAEQFEFSSVQDFSRAFKNLKGDTPTNIRKKYN